MSDPNQQQMYADAGLSVSITGQITVAAIALILVLLLVVLVLYLRAKGYAGTTGSPGSRRLVFAPHNPSLPRRALDPVILSYLPITTFQSKAYEDDGCLECAVCLSELADGEEVRLLPKCKHGFHVECIDMWFHSNNTCPLCRSLVNAESIAEGEASAGQAAETAVEAGSSTASDKLDEGSSSYAALRSSRKRRDGMLVIDIPTRITGASSSAGTPPLPSSKVPSNSPLPTSRLVEEIRSPILGRMMSLKRMLSRGSFKAVVGSTSYAPIGCDIEKGELAESKCH